MRRDTDVPELQQLPRQARRAPAKQGASSQRGFGGRVGKHRVQVEEEQRLDKVISTFRDVGSRSKAKRAISNGKVDVNGELCTDPGTMLAVGAVVTLNMNRPGTGNDRRASEKAMADAGLTIVYRDDDVVAVNKPSGLLTDSASVEQHRHRDTVRKRLRAWLRSSGQLPRVVHRIDRDTTGVVLFACNEQAEAKLRRQFRERRPLRVYKALVHGVPDWSEQRWVDHTRWHKGRRILEQVHEKTPGSVETISDVRVVRTFRDAAEIEVSLTTGRRNQIRLQATLRGHPLIGERLYVSPIQGGLRIAPRQCLHAAKLEVRHPSTNRTLTLKAPVPTDWRKVVSALQKEQG